MYSDGVTQVNRLIEACYQQCKKKTERNYYDVYKKGITYIITDYRPRQSKSQTGEIKIL